MPGEAFALNGRTFRLPKSGLGPAARASAAAGVSEYQAKTRRGAVRQTIRRLAREDGIEPTTEEVEALLAEVERRAPWFFAVTKPAAAKPAGPPPAEEPEPKPAPPAKAAEEPLEPQAGSAEEAEEAEEAAEPLEPHRPSEKPARAVKAKIVKPAEPAEPAKKGAAAKIVKRSAPEPEEAPASQETARAKRAAKPRASPAQAAPAQCPAPPQPAPAEASGARVVRRGQPRRGLFE